MERQEPLTAPLGGAVGSPHRAPNKLQPHWVPQPPLNKGSARGNGSNNLFD